MSYIDKLDVTQKQLRFLHKQFKEILDEKVRTALPESSEDDEVTQEIKLQLDQFLMEVLEMAGESMNVVDAGRGSSVKSIIQEVQKEYMEPFDVELNENVRQLYQEWEDETVKVSKLRRDAPQAAVSEYSTQERQLLEAIDSRLDESQRKMGPEPEFNSEDYSENDLKYWTEVASQYTTTLMTLKDVDQEIPDHESKLARLRLVIEMMEKEVDT